MANAKTIMSQFPDVLDFDSPNTIADLFDMSEIADGITCTVIPEKRSVLLKGNMNNTDFSLTVDVSGSNGHTKPWQVVTAAKLFWYCYPQMYARFNNGVAPRDVILLIEDFDYEIACAWENKVHIHDQWLEQCPLDFDCLTHEFAHTVQGDWEDDWMPANGEDTYMVERFADYCRYLYAYQGGLFNDLGWEIQTIENEDSPFDSVRFWAWLDYTYSTPERDIIREMNACIHKKTEQYAASEWLPTGPVWQEIFEGTGAAGKNLFVLWAEYSNTEMSKLPSGVEQEGEISPLQKAVDLRAAINNRYAEARTYLKVK